MLKQVELYGRRFEFCSIDGGRTWSNDLRSLIAYKRRQERARLELQKRLAQTQDDITGPDPSDISQLTLPKGSPEDN